MAQMARTSGTLASAILALCLLTRVESATKATAEITGHVYAPSIATTRVYLHMSTGETRMTYLAPDSTFTFKDVPLGMHLIRPFHLSAYFPEYQVDLGKHGIYRAQLIAQNSQQQTVVQGVEVPLKLRPLSDLHYYERRKPVDVWSFIKSPYGIMIAFSLFVIVVMPRLKMDPEDMREMQEQARGGSSRPAPRVTGGSGGAVTNRS